MISQMQKGPDVRAKYQPPIYLLSSLSASVQYSHSTFPKTHDCYKAKQLISLIPQSFLEGCTKRKRCERTSSLIATFPFTNLCSTPTHSSISSCSTGNAAVDIVVAVEQTAWTAADTLPAFALPFATVCAASSAGTFLGLPPFPFWSSTQELNAGLSPSNPLRLNVFGFGCFLGFKIEGVAVERDVAEGAVVEVEVGMT